MQPGSREYDCHQTFLDTPIQLQQGSQYIVKAETSGVFSKVHEPDKESDKCVLWLVNVLQNLAFIISDKNTESVGTKIMWPFASGTFYFRVNAYHKNNTSIYAYNVRIHNA